MTFQQLLVRTLVQRFGGGDIRLGLPPGPVAVFRAQHPAVGDASVSAELVGPAADSPRATIAIGDILDDDFYSLDDHLPAAERARRVTREVVRFFEYLFADRLLFWRPADGHRTAAWRELAVAGQGEPLVTDGRSYQVYLWSGPLPAWRATTAILRRRTIRDERDYQILVACLEGPDARELSRSDLDLARRLVAQYDRHQG